ncbi:MAG: GTP-dependent dephospho-CoA kinase family protein [Methanothrix sp.]|nr:GTP-dependent dephospho-CoA kinase family protein [Methanothrix sp.]
MRLLLLPDELRSSLKEPLGRLYKGKGLECVKAMEKELLSAKKVAAIGDMTAFYLLKASIVPDLLVVDKKTKRMPVTDQVVEMLDHESYKTVRVKNPAATLTKELIDLIRESLHGVEHVKIVVEGEEDLATLPAILYAPLGSVVVYGQPGEGSVLVDVTLERKLHIEEFMKRMIVEE